MLRYPSVHNLYPLTKTTSVPNCHLNASQGAQLRRWEVQRIIDQVPRKAAVTQRDYEHNLLKVITLPDLGKTEENRT